MVANTSIKTPLDGAQKQAVIAVMHQHDQYIKTAINDLIEYKHVSGTPGVGSPAVYDVTANTPIGQTSYQLTIVNETTGVSVTLDGKTPTGALKLISNWVVTDEAIEEAVEIDANFLMNKMIKGDVEKARPKQHLAFIAAAKA